MFLFQLEEYVDQINELQNTNIKLKNEVRTNEFFVSIIPVFSITWKVFYEILIYNWPINFFETFKIESVHCIMYW